MQTQRIATGSSPRIASSVMSHVTVACFTTPAAGINSWSRTMIALSLDNKVVVSRVYAVIIACYRLQMRSIYDVIKPICHDVICTNNCNKYTGHQSPTCGHFHVLCITGAPGSDPCWEGYQCMTLLCQILLRPGHSSCNSLVVSRTTQAQDLVWSCVFDHIEPSVQRKDVYACQPCYVCSLLVVAVHFRQFKATATRAIVDSMPQHDWNTPQR